VPSVSYVILPGQSARLAQRIDVDDREIQPDWAWLSRQLSVGP
jgi:hypothetical protein